MGGLTGPGPMGGLSGPGPMGGLTELFPMGVLPDPCPILGLPPILPFPGKPGSIALISWVSIMFPEGFTTDSLYPWKPYWILEMVCSSCNSSVFSMSSVSPMSSASLMSSAGAFPNSCSCSTSNSSSSVNESSSSRFISFLSSAISITDLSFSDMFHMLLTFSAPSDAITVSQIVSQSRLIIIWSGYSSYMGLFL